MLCHYLNAYDFYSQMDKRIMCLTVVLGLTNDEDRLIRASALRTLGVYVMYKTLREVIIPIGLDKQNF